MLFSVCCNFRSIVPFQYPVFSLLCVNPCLGSFMCVRVPVFIAHFSNNSHPLRCLTHESIHRFLLLNVSIPKTIPNVLHTKWCARNFPEKCGQQILRYRLRWIWTAFEPPTSINLIKAMQYSAHVVWPAIYFMRKRYSVLRMFACALCVQMHRMRPYSHTEIILSTKILWLA